MTTIRVVLDDRRHTFITQPAVEGMLCDNCPQAASRDHRDRRRPQ